MNDEQDSGPKSQVPGSDAQGSISQSSTTDATQDIENFNLGANAAEIAGETTPVVGEATGRFPRAPSVERGERESTTKGAFMVGAGILVSRIIGVISQRVFGYYFGVSLAADAFNAAFRIPNFLQNVFGEGALSASFIPVYANLLARKDEKESSRVASAVLTVLALMTSAIVLLGVLATPYIVSIVAWGFVSERRQLTIRLVQILFPGAALLVMSAWCLGILNSHRKFFLSYSAPVIWNVAIIISIASVIGSGLQFAVQLPTVLRFLRPLHLKLTFGTEQVQTVVRNFF